MHLLRRKAFIEAKRMQSMSGQNRPGAWELVWGQPYIDSKKLATAIEGDLKGNPTPDFRLRLLIRDVARALSSYWSKREFSRWLRASPVGDKVNAILREKLGKPGFRYLRRRFVAAPGKDELEQIFELLGRGIHDRVEVTVAGSIPTLVDGLTQRPTDDIDLVNEVPPEIRNQRTVLKQIQTKYGLSLGHVQEHYLPRNWKERRQFLGDFGGLRVYLADVYDVFVSKLSSKQERHQDDLRVMAPRLDKEKARGRLLTDGKGFLESARDRSTIETNWRFIFREPLLAAVRPAKRHKRSGPEKTRRTKKNEE
jgi:hypothetical protein